MISSNVVYFNAGLLKSTEDSIVEDFNDALTHYTSERDRMEFQVKKALETSIAKKKEFNTLLNSIDALLDTETYNSKSMFVFLVRYHIAMEISDKILGLENKELIDIVNIDCAALTNKLRQQILY